MSELQCWFCGSRGGWANKLIVSSTEPDLDVAIVECEWCARQTFVNATKNRTK